LISLNSQFEISKVNHFVLQRYKNLKIRVCGKDSIPLRQIGLGVCELWSDIHPVVCMGVCLFVFTNKQRELLYVLLSVCLLWERRTAATISRQSHILLIFSSEPPRNPRPLIVMSFEVSESRRLNYFFKNLATSVHKIWID